MDVGDLPLASRRPEHRPSGERERLVQDVGARRLKEVA